jgi:hypothetical protein
MEEERGQRPTDSVRCLQCGIAYEKPFGGGTEEQNPGCPACGYSGWIMASYRLAERGWVLPARLRSVAGQPLRPLGRWH